MARSTPAPDDTDDRTIERLGLPQREGYPPRALRLTISIVRTARVWRSLLDEHLRQIGHSAPRMEVMATILYSPQNATQIQVAKRVGIEGPTLTRTLDLLEADGLVERLPDPTDRRNKHLRLTDEGMKALAEIMALTEKLRARLLLDIPEQEIDEATRLLTIFQDRLDNGLPTLDGDD